MAERPIYADPDTGEILAEQQSVKDITIAATQKLVDEVWAQVQRDYNVMPLTALQITQKIVNAVLAGTVKEHCDILAEPLKPRQLKIVGLDGE